MRILADSGCIRRSVFTSADGGFSWVDIIAPDRATLKALNSELGLPESAAEECLDPRALPKHEMFGTSTFMILRAHLDPAPPSAGSANELTHAFAIFASPDLILTIHRRDHRAFDRLRERYAEVGPALAQPRLALLADLVEQAILTFQAPLEQLTADLQQFEEALLRQRLTETALEQVFVRKRRASVLAWMLLRTREVLQRARGFSEGSEPVIQDLRESAEVLQFRARELIEYTDNLLNLQIAIASHRTNEVMRLLTLMSVIFMPLTFIVGLYGMNFQMPEFRWSRGYLWPWALMIAVAAGTLTWFRRRGWLR